MFNNLIQNDEWLKRRLGTRKMVVFVEAEAAGAGQLNPRDGGTADPDGADGVLYVL